MSKKVFAIGEALIDLVSVSTGSLENSEGFKRNLGGAPLNVMAAANSFGAETMLSATVGNDFFGDFIISKFSKYANSEGIKRIDKFTTLAFVSLTESGERDFKFAKGADSELTIKDVNMEFYKESDIVVFSSATAFVKSNLKDTYFEMFKLSNKDKKIVVFDPNYRENIINNISEYKEDITKAFNHSNIVKLSDEEASIITGKKDIEECAKILSGNKDKIIFITLGKKGYYLIFNGKYVLMNPEIVVDSIDTTGAGDVFLGYIVGSISHLEKEEIFNFDNILSIAKKASVAAALSTTKKGALEAIPTEKEIREIVK